MTYPQELSRKADAILSQRRQAALAEQNFRNKRLLENHPEIAEARSHLNILGAGLGRLYIFGDDEKKEQHITEMETCTKQIESMLCSAGFPAEYMEAPFNCRNCSDKGYSGGLICNCRIHILNQLVYEMLSNTCKFAECSFDNFDLSFYTGANQKVMEKLLKSCKRYAADFSKNSPNLLFTGRTGLGKTHLSLAIAQEIVSSGHLVMYASAAQLISRIVDSTMGDEREDEYKKIVYGCDLLIIDDLGTEMKTHITKSEAHNLINTRLSEGRPTIINTNLSLNDIESTYDQRVTSRIIGCFAVNQFSGIDIRYQKRNTAKANTRQ